MMYFTETEALRELEISDSIKIVQSKDAMYT